MDKKNMKNQFWLRDSYNVNVKVIHSELSHRLHHVEFHIFHSETTQKISSIIQHKYVRQQRKLRILITRKYQ